MNGVRGVFLPGHRIRHLQAGIDQQRHGEDQGIDIPHVAGHGRGQTEGEDEGEERDKESQVCLLYTSDAADE